jgi:hypothetical protein
MELGSGFVIAVFVAAVLFADRLGGEETLQRRLFQAAFGFAIAVAVAAAANTFVRPAEGDGVLVTQIASNDGVEQAERLVGRGVLRLALGAAALLLALALSPRAPTLAWGGVLGGVLTIITSGTSAGVLSLISVSSITSSAEVDALALVVALAVVASLAWYGYQRWDAPARPAADPADDTSEY